MFEEPPAGPPELVIDEQHIEAVTDLLKWEIDKTRFRKRQRGQKAQVTVVA
jgi:hypothetical protein